MGPERDYTAFLSFAAPDRPLVKALRDLLRDAGEECYFAPEDLPRGGTAAWRREIIRGIKSSCCFVPVYTRHSLSRPWVLYESGIADCWGLERYEGRVSGVTHTEIQKIPRPDEVFVYDLYKLDSLTKLVIRVCLSKTQDKSQKAWDSVERKVRPFVETSPDAAKVISLARARWVFIAGNVPRDSFWTSTVADNWSSVDDYTNKLQPFVENLTISLLKAGFNIAACPQVKPVGGVVSRNAVIWLHSNCPSDIERFEIGGFYPIDRGTRESDLPREGKEQMSRYYKVHRKNYLRDKEWLIIIGGSEGSMEEFEAATDLRTVNVLAIPCFGGAAQTIWRRQNSGSKGPCKCLHKKGDCDLNRLVSHLTRSGSV